MAFSPDEVRDIFVAVFASTLILAFNYHDVNRSIEAIPAAFVIVVFSFLFHELAHKYVAHRFGVKAFFKLWPFGTVMGLILMFFPPLKFLAPGSVQIYPQRFARWKRRFEKYSNFTDINIKQVGIIAVAGPLVNIFLAAVSWGLHSTILPGNSFLAYFTMVNAWFAAVNMLPVKPLDGAKVFTWKPWLWLVLIAVSAIFLVFTVPSFI